MRKPICPASSRMPNRASEISPARARCRARRHDRVALASQHQSGAADAPEPVRNVERLERRQPLGHHSLTSFPDPIDDEVQQGPGLRLVPEEEVKELVDEPTVVRQGNRSSTPRDPRADRGPKSLPPRARSRHPADQDARLPAPVQSPHRMTRQGRPAPSRPN